mmetsp:Transcript_26257/g.87032  ORF Transcript_26257/g.87032 Transcript_26257/m.87032 type:complete len:204 (+) Transcript_26257:258-869(+)
MATMSRRGAMTGPSASVSGVTRAGSNTSARASGPRVLPTAGRGTVVAATEAETGTGIRTGIRTEVATAIVIGLGTAKRIAATAKRIAATAKRIAAARIVIVAADGSAGVAAAVRNPRRRKALASGGGSRARASTASTTSTAMNTATSTARKPPLPRRSRARRKSDDAGRSDFHSCARLHAPARSRGWEVCALKGGVYGWEVEE